MIDVSAALRTHQGSWGGPNQALCPGAHWRQWWFTVMASSSLQAAPFFAGSSFMIH
jgi:hypothetical protein